MASQNIGIQGWFFGMDAATLTAMQTTWQTCLAAIAVAGQAYTVQGRQFTRAHLPYVSQMVMEINAALARAQGTRTTQTYARFSNSSGGQIPAPGVSFGDLT